MKKHIKKVALSGVLLVGTMLSANAAFAAPQTFHSGDAVNHITKKYGIDLESLFKNHPKFSKFIIIGQDGFKFDFSCNPIPDKGNGSKPAPSKPDKGDQGSKPAPSKPDKGDQGSKPAPSKPDKGDQGSKPAPSKPDQGNQGSKPAPTQPNQGDQGNKPAPTQPDQGQSDISQYAKEVAELVNQERAKAGLKPLQLDSALSAMALDKAKDMYHNNYFDHNSPTYGSPFDMMDTYGIKYSYAGENIAKGQRTPEEVMNAWMNSPGHKKNIMSPNFTKIGVAYYQGEWVQEFIG
ncbi:uncharacterized protein, YkwD family [Chlamydia abortus]|uniref:CAP domain-containing protein n=1 Tax=Paenibacillus sp. SAFN-117 TaxID=3436860 RepID=UPI000A27ED90|nr:uncharacterized protein, YkwD family [Chlamydia abortus]